MRALVQSAVGGDGAARAAPRASICVCEIPRRHAAWPRRRAPPDPGPDQPDRQRYQVHRRGLGAIVAASNECRRLRIEVADTASASPQGDQERIFERLPAGRRTRWPSRQAAPASGLPFRKRIVEMHGGTIAVRLGSRAGLDLHHRSAARAGAPRRRRHDDASGSSIVEDMEDNRRIMRDLLTNAGFEIIEAHDGEAAVRRRRANIVRT